MGLFNTVNSPEAIAARAGAIAETLLRESSSITQPDFTKIGDDDLRRLFELYDSHFFGGWLAQALRRKAAGRLAFRVSSRMTRMGGKTTQTRHRPPGGERREEYEIAVGVGLLFRASPTADRPVLACGLPCANRLQALLRIMEHELVHLAEMLRWGRSNCSRERFKTLARNLFGHTDSRHALLPAKVAPPPPVGLRVGGQVAFDFRDRVYEGRINRIRRRATVLVEDGQGRLYSDGKRYASFYVPLHRLRKRGQGEKGSGTFFSMRTPPSSLYTPATE